MGRLNFLRTPEGARLSIAIDHWFLIDLSALRAHWIHGFSMPSDVPNGDGTFFKPFDVLRHFKNHPPKLVIAGAVPKKFLVQPGHIRAPIAQPERTASSEASLKEKDAGPTGTSTVAVDGSVDAATRRQEGESREGTG